MRILFVLALAAITLPACRPAADKAATGEAIAEGAGVGGGPSGRSGDPVDRAVENVAIPDNLDEGTNDSRLPPDGTRQEGVPPATNPLPKPTNIPAQFRGRWGINAADCEPGRSDAKGLMTIDDARLVFYESRGVLDRIDSNSPPNRLVANYGFRGEGQTWERVETLTVRGAKLERVSSPTADQSEPIAPLTYTRCPG